MSTIVHFSSVHPAYDNRILFKECASLAESGHNVYLVVPHTKKELIKGVTIVPVPPAKSRIGRIFKVIPSVWLTVKKLPADIYHFHDPELIPLAFLLRILRRKPVIFDMHENTSKSILTKHWIPKYLRPLVSLLYTALEKSLLRWFPVVFAEDSYVKDYPYVKKYQVVHNFPRVEAFSTTNDRKFKNLSVVYLGGVSNLRCFDSIYQAWILLEELGLQFNFHCIGPIHESVPVKDFERLNFVKTRFYGYLPAPEAYKIVQKCHVGLALLKPIPNYLESYPTKMFEYMATGIPVIVSDFPFYKAVIETHQCGICVNPEIPKSISEAFTTLLGNPDTIRKMGENGRRAASLHYSWEVEANKLHKFYKGITKEVPAIK